MKKYNFTAVRYSVDAQQLLRMAWHETSRKPSVAYQHTALLTLQIAISRLSRPYQGGLPSCELHMHSRSLTVRRTGVEIRRLCMQIMQSRDCVRVLRYLKIAQILRLRGTYFLPVGGHAAVAGSRWEIISPRNVNESGQGAI